MTDPYLDPQSGVLKNKLGVTSSAEFEKLEFEVSALRDTQLARSPIPGQFDLDHVCAIHGYLFQDLFDWAGLMRTVTISKDNSTFCFPEHIEVASAEVFGLISPPEAMKNHDKAGIVAILAEFLGELNALHPFREGNGRTQRSFIRQLAATAGWRLDWTQLETYENTQASIASMSKNYKPFEFLLATRITPMR